MKQWNAFVEEKESERAKERKVLHDDMLKLMLGREVDMHYEGGDGMFICGGGAVAAGWTFVGLQKLKWSPFAALLVSIGVFVAVVGLFFLLKQNASALRPPRAPRASRQLGAHAQKVDDRKKEE